MCVLIFGSRYNYICFVIELLKPYQPYMFEPTTVIIILGTFLFAGIVKGIIGLGLPTISLALLTIATSLPTSMALLLVPSLVTNIWQAAVGGKFREILTRLWPLFLTAAFTVWLGVLVLSSVELTLLSALLGTLLMIYAVINLSGYRFNLNTRHEWWVGFLAGSVNGILTGMTGSFVVPGVFYLQSIGLRRDMLIQSMGILFTVSTLALMFSLQGNELLTLELGVWSSVSVVPAIFGMAIGQRIRKGLSEKTFRKLFFLIILAIGTYIVVTAMQNYIFSVN